MEIASNDILIAVKRGKVEEKTAPFEEVSGDVKALLTEEKSREAQSNFFRGLRERTSIVIHDHDLFPKPEAKTEAPAPSSEKSGDVQTPQAEKRRSKLTDIFEAIDISSDTLLDRLRDCGGLAE